jgi:hypothetical protein
MSSKFHLRIRPKDIIQNYLDGKYDTMNVSKTKQEETTNYGIASKFGNTAYDERYIVVGRSNNPITIVTTNHNQFTQNFTNIPETSPLYKKPIQNYQKRCRECNIEFIHDHVGIPIRMENTHDNFIFYCKDIFHSFECAYRYLTKNPRSRLINTIDANYADSEFLLKFLFSLVHPDKILTTGKESDLLYINNGPLSQEEFRNPQLHYRQLNNVICTTVKSEYIQYLNKN